MRDRFDLIVVGGGTAGLTAARIARQLGARVALVERERIGGDCTWTGCIPSKALLHVARLAHEARTASSFGIIASGVQVDFTRVMQSVDATIKRVYAFETPEVLQSEGVAVVSGQARFCDPHTVDVDGRVLHGRHVVLCTGAEPAVPPIPGLDDVDYLTTATVFSLTKLPNRLVVIGGGATGVELSQAFQRLGSQVTLIESGDRLLSFADPAASTIITDVLRNEGVEVQLSSSVERVERSGDGIRVTPPEGAVVGDQMLVATGRRPVVDGLGLDGIGVETTSKGIVVDEHLRTTQGHIYAAGDVTGGPQFTHYAGWQGAIAVRNALVPLASKGVRQRVPWIVFTDPEIAQVGLTEAEARDEIGNPNVVCYPAPEIDRAQTANELNGFFKLMTQQGGRLVGATVVGSGAGETINELSLAIEQRLTTSDLAPAMHAYPTWGITVQEASSDVAIGRLTRGVLGRILRVVVRRW